MPVQKHVHTYAKWKSRPKYYKCLAPDCTHYMHKDLLIGKATLCCLCGQDFLLSKNDLKLEKPRCLGCSKSKKGKNFRKAQELTRYLGTESFVPLSTSAEQLSLPEEPEILYYGNGDEEVEEEDE